MSIIRYRPRSVDRFNWDSILDRFFDDSEYSRDARIPAVDVHENESGFTMDVELPGMSEKDVEIKVENGVLSISSVKDEKKEETDEKLLRHERSRYGFRRTFVLPDSSDVDGISASFKNGLLSVVIPKAPAAKPKMIEVTA